MTYRIKYKFGNKNGISPTDFIKRIEAEEAIKNVKKYQKLGNEHYKKYSGMTYSHTLKGRVS